MEVAGHRSFCADHTAETQGSTRMNDEQRSSVGFFRGLLAVLRGTAHAVGRVLGLLGRGLAAITRRSRRRTTGDSTQGD
jgi:hypothetical protein